MKPLRPERTLAMSSPQRHVFVYCKLRSLIGHAKTASAPPATSLDDHCCASRLVNIIKRDFLANVLNFYKQSGAAFDDATVWPIPPPLHEHLRAVCYRHHRNIASVQGASPQLTACIKELSMAYKKEWKESEEWKEAGRLLRAAESMITTLNRHAEVE